MVGASFNYEALFFALSRRLALLINIFAKFEW